MHLFPFTSQLSTDRLPKFVLFDWSCLVGTFQLLNQERSQDFFRGVRGWEVHEKWEIKSKLLKLITNRQGTEINIQLLVKTFLCFRV